MAVIERVARDPVLDAVEQHARAYAAFVAAPDDQFDTMHQAELLAFEAVADVHFSSVADCAALVAYLRNCGRAPEDWPDDFAVELLTALEAAFNAMPEMTSCAGPAVPAHDVPAEAQRT